MKKLLKWVFMGVLVFGFVACGGGGSNTSVNEVDKTPVKDLNSRDNNRSFKINNAPISQDIAMSTFKNIRTNGIFSALDNDDKFLIYTIESSPTHGLVEIIENSASFKYVPNKDFVGEDSFTYRAFDGEKYSDEATISINVKEIGISAVADDTAPLSTMIVSLDAQKNAITLFWLGAKDDITPSNEIRYEIYISTDSNFTIDSSTLNQTLVNTLEADISGLEADTLYYIKIKAIDNNDNFSISAENSIKTLIEESKIGNNITIKKATDLHLEDAQKVGDKLIFKNSSNIKVPIKGDILIGNPTDAYLKKVVEVKKDDNSTEITVEDVAISEVLQSAKLSSKVLLFNTADTGDDSPLKKMVNYKSNGMKEQTTSWGSGRFSVVQSENLQSSRIKRKIVGADSEFTVRVVKDDIQVIQNQKLTIDVLATMNKSGTDDDWKFTKVELVSLTHPSNSSSNNFQSIFTSGVAKWLATGKFQWTPNKHQVSTEPYIAKFKVYAEDSECSDTFDMCDDGVETIEAKITVIGDGKVDTGGTSHTKLSSGSKFSNYVTLDFTPTLVIEHEIDGHSLEYAKVALNGKLTFDVLSKFKYSASATYPTKSVAIIKPKTYRSVYMAGGIPIYQEITISIDAEFSAVAEGSVTATSDLQTSFEIEAGMEYKNGSWRKIVKNDLRKDYTATITAEGGVKVNVRIIPNIEIKFYEVASAGLSVEPWLSGDLRASATAKFNTDFVDSDAMAIHRLEQLDILVGVDAKVYADLSIWEWNIAHYPSEGGKKTIFATKKSVFSIPKIELKNNGVDICSNEDFKVDAKIINPKSLIKNNFVDSSIEWRVFPSAGATITPSSTNNKEATFNFSKKDNYTVYMLGHNEKLGSIVGQQYETIEVDTRDCIIDNTPPIISLNGDENITLQLGDSYQEFGARVVDDIDGEIKVTINGNVNSSIVGTYTISYNAIDKAGNQAEEKIRTIIIEEAETKPKPPSKTLTYAWQTTEWSNCKGECGINRGIQSRSTTCQASDGTIVEDTLCTENKPRVIQFCTASECPTVEQEDTTAPIITLNGEATITLSVGDAYNELGAITDDGSEVIIAGTVDTSTADTYTIRYNATDTAGNHAIEKSRTITVTAQALSEVILNIGDTTTREEQKTIVIPINETDTDNRISTVTCVSTPNTIDFNNTNAIITINMPNYSDIQEFSIECIAYDIDKNEIASDAILVSVKEKDKNASINLSNGLVAHYEFEGNANDSSGVELHTLMV